MTPALKAAIDLVYSAFSDVSRPKEIPGCRCAVCPSQEEIDVLLSKPLRTISPDELTRYAESVFLTVGTVADFHYFLPRILEIVATDRYWWPSPEVVGRAIAASDLDSWTVIRNQALLKYLQSVVEDILKENDYGYVLDQWICAIGRTDIDLWPYLKQVSASSDRLIEFYEMNNMSLIKNKLSNSFWDSESVQEKLIVDWLKSEEIQAIINKGYEIKQPN